MLGLVLRERHLAPRVSVERTGDAYQLTNEDGTWTVETRCRTRPGVTVGPGYVSRVVTKGGTVLVDDAREAGTLNDPRYGGLGAFGWHHARGRPGRIGLSLDNAWEVSGRTCARAAGGFGVAASRVARVPRTDERVPTLAVEVDLTDRFTFPRPLVRLRYHYRLRPRELEVHVTVVSLCPSGRCGRTRALAFVKEPKLVAHVTGGDYDRMTVLDRTGRVVCAAAGAGTATGPILETTQCDDDGRALVRFGEDCRRRACLVVEATSARGRWESGTGLDGWAVAAAGRPRARDRDTGSIDGVRWSCHSRTPAAGVHRRWELAGRRDSDGRALALGALFPAWEGGRGGYDCEPLARLFGPRGESFTARLAYSLVES